MIDICLEIKPCYEVSGPGIDGRFGIIGINGYEGSIVITNPVAIREEGQHLQFHTGSACKPEETLANLISFLESIRNDVDTKIHELKRRE